MIFQGLAEERLQGWTAASRRASEDVAHWRKVVGVDLERALGVNLFRVLEWREMEVFRALDSNSTLSSMSGCGERFPFDFHRSDVIRDNALRHTTTGNIAK